MTVLSKKFGAQWLGDLSDEWRQMRARYIFTERKEKSTKDDIHLTPSQKYAVLPQLEYMKRTGNRVVLNLMGADNMKHVEKGDFIIHLRSFQGGIEYSAYTGKVSNAYTVLAPKDNVNHNFFRYVLKSYGFISELSRTTDQLRDGQSVKFSQLDLLDFPLPTPETQQKIADFLNQETVKIDNLTHRQERLLQLLEEKRRATITHAVTRGLDPNVELKETNIPWLGKIPAHWKITKVGYEAKFESGGYPLPKNSNEPKTEPWILIGDMKADAVEGRDGISKKDIDELRLRKAAKGELLFSFKMSIGKVAIAGHDTYTTSEIATFYDMESILTEYAFYMFPIYIPRNAKKNMMGSDLMNLQLIRQAMIALPMLEEQRKIVSFISEECSKIKDLKQKIQTQITLLRERRTSLVSHAVTGKIKV